MDINYISMQNITDKTTIKITPYAKFPVVLNRQYLNFKYLI